MKRRVWGVSAVAAAAIAVAGSAVAAHAGNPDDTAVEAAFKSAMVAAQNSFSDSSTVAAARRLKTGESTAAPRQLTQRPSAARIAQVDLAGRTSLKQHFTGAALDEKLTNHAKMIAESKADSMPGFTPLGGGVSDVTYQDVKVDGAAATVKATVTTWARMSEAQPDGTIAISQPSNDLLVDAALTKTADGWKVSELTWQFAPGSAP